MLTKFTVSNRRVNGCLISRPLTDRMQNEDDGVAAVFVNIRSQTNATVITTHHVKTMNISTQFFTNIFK